MDGFNQRRTEIADYYNKELGSCKDIAIPETGSDMRVVWHQYAFRCDDKDEMGNFLASKGVGSAAFYPVPLHLQKAFEYLEYQEGDLPIAEKLTKQTVCLPVFPELKQEELEYIVASVKEFYE